MDQEELKEILRLHALWLSKDPNLAGAGKQAHLAGADLTGAILRHANLQGAILRHANLQGAHLEGAHLEGANLTGANLTRANLRHANLQGAHLEGAHLEGANLTGANLTGAYLHGADLWGACLYKAHLAEAHLTEADLTGAKLKDKNELVFDRSGSKRAAARAPRAPPDRAARPAPISEEIMIITISEAIMNTNIMFDEVFSDNANAEATELSIMVSPTTEISTEDSSEVPPEETTVSLAESVVTAPANLKYYKGGHRYELVFSGICGHCAHCGQPLTDSESVQRGIGPVCSKKGYTDEVEPRDETEAIMALAEFPELANYMVQRYKPKGNREMVNALVRIASLNRRTPVHAACTDAVDALGYTKLASALRESISSIEIYEITDKPDCYAMWIKKHDFSWSFWSQLKNQPGVYMTKFPKPATIVPKSQRKELAKLLVSHYSGLYIKTPKGSHKITEAWFGLMSVGAPKKKEVEE